jgi:7-cyano-7-deazaguanine synthase
MIRSLCHLSGGYDSMASTLLQIKDGREVYCLFVNYGQSYLVRELAAARHAFESLKKQYPAQVKEFFVYDTLLCCEGIKREYVPHRNLVIAAISMNMAAQCKCTEVAVGSKGKNYRNEDHECIFCDGSVEFFDKFNETVREGTEPQDTVIQIVMPLHKHGLDTKTSVLQCLVDNGVPLNSLWTCYKTGGKPCGTCHHCHEFIEAEKGVVYDEKE